MVRANFAVNDLLRRRLQTSLTVATLMLSVASTLFLLLFSNRLGVGIATTSGTLTLGLTALLGQFILFVGVLIFVVGTVLTSFVVFLMMTQRTRDFGLIKAAGCPNSLVAGYFMNELLTVAFVGCLLGVILGFLGNLVVSNIVFSAYQIPFLWFGPLVFVTFFVLAIIFGLQPLFKASKMSAVQAISLVNYYGLTMENTHKVLSKSRLTWRVASRSLIRRQSGTFRIVILLSIVFILLTISVAGGIIAKNTTESWIQNTLDSQTVVITHNSLETQYSLLLSKFVGAIDTSDFNLTDPNFAIQSNVISQLEAMSEVKMVDSRLVLYQNVSEVGNFTVVSGTSNEIFVGDSRKGQSLVIGVDPQKLVGSWSVKGRFLNHRDTMKAVIGDSISHSMYYTYPSANVVLSDPLSEGIQFQNTSFDIVGICVDPLNNGFVTYVPLNTLENITGIFGSNILFIKLSDTTNRDTVIVRIRSIVQESNPNLDVFDLSDAVQQNVQFLATTWQIIMFLPPFDIIISCDMPCKLHDAIHR
jgi:ABC-type lipoprotein release transport system permease subunit